MAGFSHNSSSAQSGTLAPGVSYTIPLMIVTALFFMWGFLTSLNDILIPHFINVFSLSLTEASYIQLIFFGAYFLISLPSGWIISKTGYKNGIIIGLLIAGVGAFMFYPAATSLSYPIFLSAIFVLGSGITLLQVAANPYVAILGKPETSSSRLNLTQAFNSLGTTIGPFLGSVLILSAAAASIQESANAVQLPYIFFGASLWLLAIFIYFSKLPVIEAASEVSSIALSSDQKTSAFQYPHLVLGVIAIFMYVGGEVALGSYAANFLILDNVTGWKESLGEKDALVQAGKYVSFYWGGAMVGRFIGSALLSKVNPGRALGFCASMVSVLILMVVFTSGNIAMWSLLCIGLFNSIMFPTIFTLAINALGKFTKQGSSLLVMAIVGGAVIPFIYAKLADTPSIGIQRAFLIPLLCYAYIAFYGYKGSRNTVSVKEKSKEAAVVA